MSPTYTAAAVSLLVVVLPMFGIRAGADEVTGIIQAATVIISSIVIMIRRYQDGDINILGARK